MVNREPIEVRIGGKKIKDAINADDSAALEHVSKAIIVAHRMARRAKSRVLRGLYVGKPRAYSTQTRRRKRADGSMGFVPSYFISEGYREKIGAEKKSYKNSMTFHQAVGGKPGNVTGGLLSGIRVRNYGIKGAVVEFAGRSLGSRSKKRKRGGKNERVKVANRKKARQVWWRLKVNLLQPDDREIQSLGCATALLLSDEIAKGMTAKRGERNTNGDVVLVNRIIGDIKNGVQVKI